MTGDDVFGVFNDSDGVSTSPQESNTDQQKSSPSDRTNEEAHGMHLKRSLNLPSACSLLTTMIIGSGIFITPSEVAKPASMPLLSLVIWGAAGGLIILGAYCYCELGIMIPEVGGEYAYLREIFGDFFGFMYVWMAGFIEMPCIVSVVALAAAKYICASFNYQPSERVGNLIATILIVIITALNCASIRMTKVLSYFTTVVKCGALFTLIVAGLVHVARGHSEYLTWKELTALNTGSISMGKFSEAYFSATFAYSGWQNLPAFSEEIRDPAKNLPRSLFISLPLVTIIYVLSNVFYISAVGGKIVSTSETIAADVSNVVLPFAVFAVPICVFIACIGTLSGGVAALSRIFFSGARYGHLPAVFCGLHRLQATPIPALILQAFITISFVWSAQIAVLMPTAGFVICVVSFLIIIGLLKLRYTDPERERIIKPFIGIPIFTAFVFFGIIAVAFTIYSMKLIITTALTLIGVPVYVLCCCWNKPDCYHSIADRINKFIMLLTCCVPEDRDVETDLPVLLKESSMEIDTVKGSGNEDEIV